MSYCRLSSNDHQCDVYVYGSDDGWETYVAGSRVVFKTLLPGRVSLPHPFTAAEFEAWAERGRVVSRMVDEAERVDIDLPHAAGHFVDSTPSECAKTLIMLRDLGYRVPQYVIDDLLEEEDGT